MTRYLGTFSMSVAIANTAPRAMPRMNAMSPSSLPMRPHRLEPMMNPTVAREDSDRGVVVEITEDGEHKGEHEADGPARERRERPITDERLAPPRCRG